MAKTRAPHPMARGADRLSDLPEGVLHHILSLLPAQDAVRTCVLAPSWRTLWRSAPALSVACSPGVDGAFFDGLLRARRRGPPLDSCDFDLDLGRLGNPRLELEPRGNGALICRLLQLKVRELRFRVVSTNPWRALKLDYTLLSSDRLTSLELSGVKGNPYFLYFCRCWALERLKMERCVIDSMEMSSHSVKHLSIKNCVFYSDYRQVLWFPSLVSFEFVDNSGRAPVLERMPDLETAIVGFGHRYADRCRNGRSDHCGDAACRGCVCYYGPAGSGCVFLQGLAEATYLSLSASDMYVFSRDLKWRPTFNNLKTLVLTKWFLSTDLNALIWFLRHAPLLEKLTLEIPKDHKSFMETERSYNPLEKSIAPSHLQNVEIECKYVDGIVRQVLKVLNANGIPRGKIRIQCPGYNFVCTDINNN